MSRTQALRELLAAGEELTIVCHNNPDPDCLASALALGRVAAGAGIDEQHILYSGTISHQQNRAFINLLEIDLTPFDAAAVVDRAETSLLAFVDHSVPGANNEVPEGTRVDVVIDHHPAEDVEARFVDHRESAGATATILTEYVRELDVELDDTLATALLFAIRRETLGFLRGVTVEEYAAGGTLHDHADLDLLRALSNPAVNSATVDAIGRAISNRRVRQSVLFSHVGRTSERDALPQAADYLVGLEGVETAVVFGIVEDAIELSARSTDSRIHIGDAVRDAFETVGSGGGHREMAGAEIPLGIFADYTDDDGVYVDIIEEIVTNRLADALRLTGSTEHTDDGSHGAGEGE